MPMTKKEIIALIDLLDDPDENVFQEIRSRLIKEGLSVVQALEGAWINNYDALRQKRIENIVHRIQFNNIDSKLNEWARLGANSIYTGALLVAKYQYPELDEEEVRSIIDKIKNDVWLELNDNLTGLEKVKVLNHILFKEYGFVGNKEDYHNPKNSFINKVIESKKGNPLTLSIIYLILAQELEIPISGVNLPEHFVLAYTDKYGVLSPDENKEMHGVLFYINPFSNGQVFGKKDIIDFLKQLNIEPEDRYFQPCSNIQMIIRMMNNLKFAYKKLGKEEKADEMNYLIRKLMKNIN